MGWQDAPIVDKPVSRWDEAPLIAETRSDPIKIGKDAFPDTLRQTLKEADWVTRNLAGAGTAVTNLWEGGKQLFGQSNQDNIRNQKIIRDEAPIGGFLGDVALTVGPFGLVGPSIKAASGLGALYGLMKPVEADNASDAIKGKVINTGIGAAAAGGGQWVANKILGAASNKLSDIEQFVQERAAKAAASETASARSAAGNAAQNAYRQLEHLRELGANRALTAQEQLTVTSLERELAEKSLDNLIPAAALKQSTSDSYKDAISTEAARAAKYAAEKLSGNEIKQQIMARVKRYGPAAIGGMLGNMIFPGLGGSVGGAATGLVLRPAIRSMVNLSKNPAVQHGLLSSVQNSALLNSSAMPIAPLLIGEGLLGQ